MNNDITYLCNKNVIDTYIFVIIYFMLNYLNRRVVSSQTVFID